MRGKQPVHQYGNGAREQYGADRGHGGADRSAVWLPLAHIEKETPD